ncbi:hypothetical protein E2C01_076954 [Portunus trituberculatus]|uniref:Uncharacterized protein n=1 Tax=Portunus trituberculatus TaxID=210409 RepID=A0A5B7IKF4_PORTR|nr:hypothetical protein [Portunus trituberculatus]
MTPILPAPPFHLTIHHASYHRPYSSIHLMPLPAHSLGNLISFPTVLHTCRPLRHVSPLHLPSHAPAPPTPATTRLSRSQGRTFLSEIPDYSVLHDLSLHAQATYRGAS